jgi:multidrug transporter EmrE-like cation transporter
MRLSRAALARHGESAIDPVAIALVLVAAVVHASWNRVLHAEEDRVAAMAVAGLFTGVMLLPAVLLWPPWAALPFVVASAVTHVFYALGLSAAYRRGALSVAYPLGRGVAPLLVTLGGWLLLAERPDETAVLGAAALAVGLALIAISGGRAGQGAAVGFALLTGLTIATYSVVDAAAVRQVSPVGYLGAVLGIQGLLLTGLVRGDRLRLRSGLRSPAGPLRLPAGSRGPRLHPARVLRPHRSPPLRRAPPPRRLDRRHPRPHRRPPRGELATFQKQMRLVSIRAPGVGLDGECAIAPTKAAAAQSCLSSSPAFRTYRSGTLKSPPLMSTTWVS